MVAIARMHVIPRIRAALPTDDGALAALGARTFRATFGAQNTTQDMDAYVRAAFAREQMAAELADPDNHYLLAFAADAEPPIGYAKWRVGVIEPAVRGRRPVELQQLYVDPAAIGCGVGAALMRACLTATAAGGHDTLWLGVWERNARALAFYRRWGFAEVGEHVFRLGNDDQRDILMQRAVAG